MENIYTLEKDDFPSLLKEINDPPERLFVKGNLPRVNAKVLCVVGARRYSNYGEEACKKLISGLIGYNICIVSGLALGIDSIAHRAALDTGLQTIAFPGSGLDPKVLYPHKHRKLAEEIVYAGGALISEFEMWQAADIWTFPKRNRLMAGISDATLVIEAKEKSGTLITSRLAMEYYRDVGAVPGQIYSQLAEGPNNLINDGARIIRNSNDILEMLGFRAKEESGQNFQPSLLLGLTETERKIIEFLQIENCTSEQLVQKSGVSVREINEAASSLEIQGLIRGISGRWRIS